jgi:zinc/manganese transport system permease protein
VEAFFTAMLWPLLLCLCVAGLHAYLGLHVLARRVVFADLALAQAAGLGAVWGVLLGWNADESPWAIRAFALAFTLIGAVVLASLRARDIPREAVAASIYVVAAGGTILVGASLHHGIEEVRELLTGAAIWVLPGMVLATAVLFALIGVLLFVLRAKWAAAPRAPAPVGWDLAFYAVLGIAVSHTVPLVGVLLTFAYLLLPAATGQLFSKQPAGQMRAAWVAAVLATLAGFGLSYASDLPLEPTLVVSLGAVLGVAAAYRYLAGTRDRLGASIGVLGGATVFILLLSWSYQMRPIETPLDLTAADAPPGARMALVDRVESDPQLWERERTTLEALLEGGDLGVRTRLLALIAERGDESWLEQVHGLLTDPDDFVRESALACVRALGRAESAGPLAAAVDEELDEFLRVEFADALLALGDSRGTAILEDLAANASTEGVRREAQRRLTP